MVRKAVMILVASATVALAAVSAAPARVATPAASERTPVLQRVVRELVADGAPGAVAVVRTSTKIRRAAAGVAQRTPRVPLRATDRFRVASITKSFAATIVLQMVGEGKLSLSDSIERWLPGVVPNGGAITLRRLLDHTSGLFDFNDASEWQQAALADPRRQWAPRELVAAAVAHPPYFAPGAGWHYSNTNYVLLGLVVEAATGKPFADELRDRLLQPVSLAATSLPAAPATERGLVHGYVGAATLPGLSGLVDVTALLNPSWSWAAGALVSNADDVTKFYAWLLGGRILRPNVVATMRTVTPPADDYGLGLMRFDTACGRAFGHLGDFTAYRTVAVSRPNGSRVAVVAVNVDTTRLSWGQLISDAERAYCRG